VSTEIENKNLSALSIIKRLNFHLDRKRKKDIKNVVFLSMLSSLSESISIALLVPFVSFFINPEKYMFNNLFNFFFKFTNTSSQSNILFAVTFIFIFAVLLSCFLRLKFTKHSTQLAENITSDFRIKIFKFLVNQDFKYYFKHGSNEIMSNLSQKTGAFTSIIFASINFLNSILISLSIGIILIIHEPVYTPFIIISILSFFFIVFKVKAATILKKGTNVSINQNFMIDIFQNTIGYLPEIIIYNLRNFYLTTLSNVSKKIASSAGSIRVIALSPRIYLETFVITLVVFSIYFSDINERAIEVNISYMAILAFGAQKCLPLINGLYNLSINFKAATPVVSSFLSILEEQGKNKIEDNEFNKLKFEKSIQLRNVSFRYNKNIPYILKNISFDIKKGEKIVIKGQTGSGKSTVSHIISGLINPSEGHVYIDDTLIDFDNLKNWQKNISIVPQAVFLNDATILENIAIGVDVNSIDLKKVKNSAKLAHIDTFIESMPNKFVEKVGERGIRLSGGQRQRLGIARALYRNAELIILDEPTNALDSEKEKLIMDSISKLSENITIIMISHNNLTLKYFDKVIDLDKFK